MEQNRRTDADSVLTGRILVLEDNPDDQELLRIELQRAGLYAEVTTSTDRESFENALRDRSSPPDLILADYNVPSFHGEDSLRTTQEYNIDAPYIVVSGSIGEERVAELLKSGATDVVKKDNLSRLGPVVHRAFRERILQKQRHDSYRALQEQINLVEEIQNAVPSPVFYKDASGVYLGCNNAFATLMDVPKDKILGSTAGDIFSGGLLEFIESTDAEVLETREPRRHEYGLTDIDGNYRDFIYHKAPFYKSDGGFGGIVGVLLDVSEMKHYSRRLRSSLDLQQAVFESIDDVIVAVDSRARTIRLANTAMATVFGYRPEEVIGASTSILHVDSEHFNQFALSSEPVLEKTGVYQAEFPMQRKDGTVFPAEITVTELSKEHGWRAGVVSVIRDLSDRKEAEVQLAEREEQLRQSQRLESIGHLAGGVAHDFNNILTAMGGYIHLATDSLEEDHPAREAINNIRTGTERAARLTQQLLLFSRKVPSEKKQFDLNTVVTNMIRMLDRLIPETISVTRSLAEQPALISGDEGKIEQVIMNLVINARDAMVDGGSLEIGTTVGEEVVLTVTDEGKGMDPETLSRAFEPFYTTKPKETGTGLGLSVVYGIVQEHFGEISIDTEPGEGTTFMVRFPLSRDSTGEILTEEDNEMKSDVVGKRILIVEDEKGIVDVVKRVLTSAGYTVSTATDIASAHRLWQAAPKPFDVVLSDVVLPDGSGVALLEILQPRGETAFIFSSGYLEDKKEFSTIREGGYRFIHKPFTIPTLKKVIAEELAAGAKE